MPLHDHFIHRIDGAIVINGEVIPLDALKVFDPQYTLPTGIRSVRYTIDRKSGDGYHFQHDGVRNIRAEHPCLQLNKYIDNLQGIKDIAKNIEEETKEIDACIQMVTRDYIEKRLTEYPPIQDLIVALWEMIVEGDDSGKVQDIQRKRLHTKSKYPKHH